MRAVDLFHRHDDGPVRQPQQFGHDDAGLSVAQIVGLQAGEDQIGLLGVGRFGQQLGHAQRIERRQIFFFDMNGAIGAFGQCLANGLRCARGAGAQRHHFAAVLFLQAQRFFERESVGLVDFETEIALLNPTAAGVDA